MSFWLRACLTIILLSVFAPEKNWARNSLGSDTIAVGELKSLTANSSSIPEKALSKLLLGMTETGLAHALKTPAGHDFTGASAQEVASTTLGLKGTELLAGAVVDAMEHYSVKVSPISQDSWLIKIIPFSKMSVASLLFVVTYNTHTQQYNFFKQTHKDTVALYSGNAALGLTYDAVKSGISSVAQTYFGATAGGSDILAESCTVVLSGIVLGLVGTAGKIDIPAKKFNSLPVLMTALGIGHTVARTGKKVAYIIKHQAMAYGYSEETAAKMGTGVQFLSATAGVTLFTVIRDRNRGNPTHNYAGKIAGDITKNAGALALTHVIHPTVQKVGIAKESLLNYAESALMSPDMRAAVHPYVCQAVDTGATVFLAGTAATVSKRIDNPRTNDLVFGCWIAIGGLADIVDMSWREHLTIWSASAGIEFLLFMTAWRRNKLKTE